MLEENPLADFVELPEHLQGLRWGAQCDALLLLLLLLLLLPIGNHSWCRYSNIYCGVIKGALEMVNIRFFCSLQHLLPPSHARHVGCRVECSITKDPLCGDDSFEMKLVRTPRTPRPRLCVTLYACSRGADGG